MSLRACHVVQMPDEFAGQAINIAILQFVQFFASEIEDVRTDDHRDVGAFAVENIAVHDRPPIEAPEQAALLGRQ
jgi:hypothetical protein